MARRSKSSIGVDVSLNLACAPDGETHASESASISDLADSKAIYGRQRLLFFFCLAHHELGQVAGSKGTSADSGNTSSSAKMLSSDSKGESKESKQANLIEYSVYNSRCKPPRIKIDGLATSEKIYYNVHTICPVINP